MERTGTRPRSRSFASKAENEDPGNAACDNVPHPSRALCGLGGKVRALPVKWRGLPLIHDKTVDEWGTPTPIFGYLMTAPPAPSSSCFMIASLSVPHSKRALCVLSGRPRTPSRPVIAKNAMNRAQPDKTKRLCGIDEWATRLKVTSRVRGLPLIHDKTVDEWGTAGFWSSHHRATCQ